MGTLWQDLSYGFRMLVKRPGFTVIAVLSLALGIGANTAIFSLVSAVLIKPLPFPEAERLVMVWEDASSIGFPQDTPSPGNYSDWKTQNQVFEDMAALSWQSFNITGDGEPERVSAYAVTANCFPLLGIQPALGRNFLPSEDQPGAGRSVILSHGLWQRRYGGEQNIIGRDILLNGEKYSVVGVMPAGFQFLQSYIGLWVPVAFTQEQLAIRSTNYLTVVARLKRGVTLTQAQAEMSTIMERIARDYPDDVGNTGAAVVPLHEQLAGRTRRPLIVLLVAVGFVLLIACANVANLLLSRAAARRKEIAVRSALGARRTRIVRQLLTESLLLAIMGGALGLLLATWSFEFLKQLIPDGLLLTANLQLDLWALCFAFLVSLLTGIIFGLAPAWQASKVDLNQALKQSGGRTGGLSAGGNRLRGALVVAEVALALMLLVGAGLLIQTVFHLQQQYSLFQPEQLLTVRTVLPDQKYGEHPRRVAFYNQVLERLKTVPGVVNVGYATSVPLQWKGGASGFSMEGPQPPANVATNAIHRQVSSSYLQTMGIGLREGRFFDERDDELAPRVVIVNETFARQYWPGESALGKRISLALTTSNNNAPPSNIEWRTITGVVADVRQMGIDAPVKAEMYFPYSQITSHVFFKPRDLVVRTTGDPLSLLPAVRRELQAVDPDQPLSNIATMDKLLVQEAGARRLGMIVLTAFAALAVILAAMGIYGVLAYFVTQHTPEIGVRLALGAEPRHILAMVLKKGMSLALFGVAIGLTVAFALTRLMASLLFGVSASDPGTFVVIALLLAVVALLACYLPARRAMKVDPMVALRYE
jgi:predicted permease